jgi:hypothetical protein
LQKDFGHLRIPSTNGQSVSQPSIPTVINSGADGRFFFSRVFGVEYAQDGQATFDPSHSDKQEQSLEYGLHCFGGVQSRVEGVLPISYHGQDLKPGQGNVSNAISLNGSDSMYNRSCNGIGLGHQDVVEEEESIEC